MGKYNVKFSCGHEEQVILYGKYKDRDKKITYFEKEGLCSECYKKKVKEKIESQKSQLSPNNPDNKNYTTIKLGYGNKDFPPQTHGFKREARRFLIT